jgi:hypothetical protein
MPVAVASSRSSVNGSSFVSSPSSSIHHDHLVVRCWCAVLGGYRLLSLGGESCGGGGGRWCVVGASSSSLITTTSSSTPSSERGTTAVRIPVGNGKIIFRPSCPCSFLVQSTCCLPKGQPHFRPSSWVAAQSMIMRNNKRHEPSTVQLESTSAAPLWSHDWLGGSQCPRA